MITASWIFALAFLARGIRVRRRDVIIPVAAFSIATIGILHSLIDFSLQIPGFAVVALAVVGAGLSQAFSSRNPHSSLP